MNYKDFAYSLDNPVKTAIKRAFKIVIYTLPVYLMLLVIIAFAIYL